MELCRVRARKGEPYREHQVNAHLTDAEYRRLQALMEKTKAHRAALTHRAIVEFLDRYYPTSENSPAA